MKVLIFALFVSVAALITVAAVDPNEKPFSHPECPSGPDKNPNLPKHLVYPGNCTKFYKCLRGLAYPFDCPGGLHWSHTQIQCTFPGQEKPICPY